MEMTERKLSRDAVKYLAILAMTFNHIAFALLEPGTVIREVFRDIGSFTAITMCWFLVEGYHLTRDKKAYAKRLLLFAVLSEAPYYLALGQKQLDVLFTLLICFGILRVLEREHDLTLRPVKITLLIALSLVCDWALYLPAETLLFEKARGDRRKAASAYAKVTAVYFLISLLELRGTPLQGAPASGAAFEILLVIRALGRVAGMALSGVVVLCCCNGKKSERFPKWDKWFFYVYYPAHLTVLAILKYTVFR